MAAASQRSHAARSLVAFAIILLALLGLLAGANLWSNGGLARGYTATRRSP